MPQELGHGNPGFISGSAGLRRAAGLQLVRCLEVSGGVRSRWIVLFLGASRGHQLCDFYHNLVRALQNLTLALLAPCAMPGPHGAAAELLKVPQKDSGAGYKNTIRYHKALIKALSQVP